MSSKHEISQWIKSKSKALGFASCGIAKAKELTEEAHNLEKWLNQHAHGEMTYMANHFEKRINPEKLLPGTKSVVVFTHNYYQDSPFGEDDVKVARYALGRDYHKILKKKLKHLFAELCTCYGEIQGRYFVDSAPILERDWAKHAGLGWKGKNTLLLTKGVGSYYFIGVLLLDIELIYDQPTTAHCGNCTKCIDACPTSAISENGEFLDASKCISYLNIELKNDIHERFHSQMENWVFGCDICQEVCPWNRFALPHQEEAFDAKENIFSIFNGEWENITPQNFETIFAGTPLRRAGYNKINHTMKIIRKQKTSE